MAVGLFHPIKINKLELKNRIMMSPMCQYKGKDGYPLDWHFIHYGSRAIGGVGFICIEMTNVEKRGRITENCLGLWSENQVPAYKKIVDFCKDQGAKVCIQLAHAGRKSEISDETAVAPSAIPFSNKYSTPKELTKKDIHNIIDYFGESARLAVKAGFDAIEIHGAHGYLIHQFLSPLSNNRKDEYGDYGRFANEVICTVRKNIPEDMPLIMRISGKEYSEGGYNIEHILQYIPDFISLGVDAFDVSSGGNDPNRPEVFPAYQIELGKQIKDICTVPVIGVGRLEVPFIADSVIKDEMVDMVAIGRGLLKNPHWAKQAAEKLKRELTLPGVYGMGWNI
ncbi:NADH:flavin oxidoreductase/NADH oxidase [Virgibacillus halodenitrificans]|uniref:NADH:flavin oxidoreductase/NADH oxidase n=1 Tax=Virgibacillus halodenitrificans TaxID=1482 RepID=UPI001F47FE38|nr:NADH:flavin oxidoreductase/NADH oxidase [Virgibacillus halodenitrificans]MCG1027128.1 NADH:flavin oxidoreductase/NADH oxidase [Virgibacillus halodenitrificans]